MNKKFSCCGVHGHYTHDCPLLPQMRQLWEAKVVSRVHQPTTSLPPYTPPTQLNVFTDSFPQKGYVVAQPP